jgi:hypothetical protein
MTKIIDVSRGSFELLDILPTLQRLGFTAQMDNNKWPLLPAVQRVLPIFSGEIWNSVISKGVIVRNDRIVNAAIRRDVMMEDGVPVED